MVLDFGLLQSHLFDTSAAVGKGLGAPGERVREDDVGAGGKMKIISTQDVSASVDVEFKGLTGKKYLLVFNAVNSPTADSNWQTQINGVTTNTYNSSWCGAASGADVPVVASTDQAGVTFSLRGGNVVGFLMFCIDDSNSVASVFGHGWVTNTDGSMRYANTGGTEEGAHTSFSQINIKPTNGHITGTFSLWEFADT